MELEYVDFPIVKFDRLPDGTLHVYGPCTTDDVDSDKQIVDPEFAARKLPQWFKSGANVRVMHSPMLYPAGTGVELVREGNTHFLKSHVVDSNAITHVENKSLTAYSVGIANAKIVRDAAAPGGRIVDGDFVEISLVDRPANIKCKFNLVEKSADGSAVFTKIVKALDEDGDAKCGLCKGKGKIRQGHVKCPDCGGSGKQKDVEAKKGYTIAGKNYSLKRNFDTGVGGGVDRDKIPSEDFAGPGETYPIVTPKDVKDASGLIGHADDPEGVKAKIIAIAKRKGPEFVAELPESWDVKLAKGKKDPDDDGDDDSEGSDDDDDKKDDDDSKGSDDDDDDDDDDDSDDDGKTEKAAVPFTLKRLHDVFCPVYSDEVLADAYPAGSDVRGALQGVDFGKAVSTLITLDGGSGEHVHEIAQLSALYGCTTQLKHQQDEILAEARSYTHKAFSDMYPSVNPKPGAVTPGMYQRPFLSAGRASMSPTGKPRLPLNPTQPGPGSFDRGPLTAGQERPSPSQGAPNDATMGKIQVMREAGCKPGMIAKALGMEKDEVRKALGLADKGRAFYTNNARDEAASVMQSVHDYIQAKHPSICAMQTGPAEPPEPASAAAPAASFVHNGSGGALSDAAATDGGKQTTKIETQEIEGLVTKMVGEATAEIVKQNKSLKKQLKGALEQINKLADPSQIPYRGGRGVLPSVVKAQTDAATEAEVLAKAAILKAEQVQWYKGQVASGDPMVSGPAIQRLQEMLTGDEFAEALITARSPS